MSKRKSPALVAFVDGDRLVGEEAAGVAARYPDRVFARAADLLGRPADDPALGAMLKASYRPYTLVPAANRTSPAAAALQLDSGEQYSAEEVVVSCAVLPSAGPPCCPACLPRCLCLVPAATLPLVCMCRFCYQQQHPRRGKAAHPHCHVRACAVPLLLATLQASLLEYAKQLAEAAADGAPVTDCVLAVPASHTPQQVGRAGGWAVG